MLLVEGPISVLEVVKFIGLLGVLVEVDVTSAVVEPFEKMVESRFLVVCGRVELATSNVESVVDV